MSDRHDFSTNLSRARPPPNRARAARRNQTGRPPCAECQGSIALKSRSDGVKASGWLPPNSSAPQRWQPVRVSEMRRGRDGREPTRASPRDRPPRSHGPLRVLVAWCHSPLLCQASSSPQSHTQRKAPKHRLAECLQETSLE